jgi:hypothetical protein
LAATGRPKKQDRSQEVGDPQAIKAFEGKWLLAEILREIQGIQANPVKASHVLAMLEFCPKSYQAQAVAGTCAWP